MRIINLNAFAIGVSLIDPECRISLKYLGVDDIPDYRKEWAAEGVTMFADIEYTTGVRSKVRPGVYIGSGFQPELLISGCRTFLIRPRSF